jgi:hypothetical protein
VRELFVRWVLDGQVPYDAAAGEAQPADVEEVAARIMRSEHAAADVLAAIRASFRLASAIQPLAVGEEVVAPAVRGYLVDRVAGAVEEADLSRVEQLARVTQAGGRVTLAITYVARGTKPAPEAAASRLWASAPTTAALEGTAETERRCP